MKDIDFDELDKAVTSLMGGIADMPETARPDDDIKTLVLKPSQPMSDNATNMPAAAVVSVPDAAQPKDAVASTGASPRSVDEPVVSTASPIVVSRPAPVSNRPAPSLASRRAGRFMDVMHPSSDMAKATPTPSVSRHAGQIEPLNAAIAPEPMPVVSPAAAPALDESVVDTEPATASEWPDPLDMQPAQPSHDDVPVEIEDTAAEPLSSPFLPDAKVEKRPLGGFAQDAPEHADEPVVPPVDNTPSQLPVEPTALPEELQGDLMAIESGQMDMSTEPVPTAPATPISVATAPSVQQAPRPTGPASIQQQYKEAPSTGDQTSGAIYDTDTYHQPLQTPAKKKPSWLWIVWIAALLLIGAGGGAAAYLYLLK